MRPTELQDSMPRAATGYIGKYHGSYCAIVDEYDNLAGANKALADIAMTDADSDKRTHYRFYSDGDCTRYEVFDTESNDTEIERAIYELYQSDELR